MSDKADEHIDALLPDDEPAPELELEAEAEAEPEPEGNGEDKAKPEGDLNVALRDERERRRELTAELQQTRDRMARMETLFEQVRGETAKPADAVPEIPAYEDDPDGHYRGRLAQQQTEIDALKQQGQQQQTADQQRQQQNTMIEHYAASVRTFERDHPDFQDAYSFLENEMDADLEARGFSNPVSRAEVLKREEGFMVARALDDKKSPAELMYNYAVRRGYKPEKAEQEDDTKLDRLEKGSKAARSLSGTKATPEPQITLERLSELADEDPEEFDKQWALAQRRGLLG